MVLRITTEKDCNVATITDMIFIIIKIASLSIYRDSSLSDISGYQLTEIPVLYKLKIEDQSLMLLDEPVIWEAIYRASARFISNNYGLVHRELYKKRARGMEAVINSNLPSRRETLLTNLLFTQQEGTADVKFTSEGAKAIAISETLGFMVFLRLKTDLLFDAYELIVKVSNIDSDLKEPLLQYLEKIIGWCDYNNPKILLQNHVKKKKISSKLDIFEILFKYLDTRDSIELMFISKSNFHRMKVAFIHQILRTVDISSDCRVFIWQELPPQVRPRLSQALQVAQNERDWRAWIRWV